MGNCQAIDAAAALVIQHPSGKLDRMYCPVSASHVMKMNPGHYVSLIIPLPISQTNEDRKLHEQKNVRFTRVKLLRSTDTLVLGHAYRLVTSQEVMKVLRAKRNHKSGKNKTELNEKMLGDESEPRTLESKSLNKAINHEKQQRARTVPMNPAATRRSKSWSPSLQSISELGGRAGLALIEFSKLSRAPLF